MVELRHADADCSVVDTTYLGMLLSESANGSPFIGSNAPPWICHVFRPSRKASARDIAWKKCAPMSSCQYGTVHPPCVKPPSVSSSAPPGAWITPSSASKLPALRQLVCLGENLLNRRNFSFRQSLELLRPSTIR